MRKHQYYCSECDPEIIRADTKMPLTIPALSTYPQHIIEAICKYFYVPEAQVYKRTRKREVVNARQIMMYFIKRRTRMSLKSIGQIFGGRDHTTVIHSMQTVRDLMDTDDGYKADIAYLETLI